MNLFEFAKEVHQNAVDHGWWEGERPFYETLVLIHSEWSEALEEYRAGRPMVWFECMAARFHEPVVCDPKDEYDCLSYNKLIEGCPNRGKKPEGIAVELIDGCIRILDYLGKSGCEYMTMDDEPCDSIEELASLAPEVFEDCSLPRLVNSLHWYISEIPDDEEPIKGGLRFVWCSMLEAAGCVFRWLLHQGIDVESVLRMKHEYNKTRPWKHGGKVC